MNILAKERVLNVAGCSTSIFLISLLLSSLGFIGKEISSAIYIFISLPVVVTFLFTIFKNNPKARLTSRKYGSLTYFLVLLGVFYFLNFPSSFTSAIKLLIKFFIGLLIAFLIGIVYYLIYKFLKKEDYWKKAVFSFLVSFTISFILIFLLKRIDFISDLIS